MEKLLSIASTIQTPLSISALLIIVLLIIYKQMIARLPLESVASNDTFRLLSKIVNFTFAIAIAGLVLGLLSYGLTTIVSYKRQQQAETFISRINSTNRVDRENAITGLYSLTLSQSSLAERTCVILASFIRSGLSSNIDDERERLSDGIEQSMKAISGLLRSRFCAEVDLSGSDLRRLSLPGGTLSHVNLNQARLEEADLVGADLHDSSLIGASLDGSALRRADLSGANMQAVHWKTADISGANLSHATGLAGSNLLLVNLDHAVLDDVDLRHVRFPMTGLPGVSLKNSNLRGIRVSEIQHLCWAAVKSAITDNPGEEKDYGC